MNATLRSVALSLSVTALVITACGDDDDNATASPVVADARVREPAAGTSSTAAYATITNDGDDAVTLVGASSPLTDDVELHETLMDDDGTMSMQEREDGFVIEAGASLIMEPGGAHVMMLGIDPADVTGEIEITFDFDGAEDVTVEAPVEALPTADDDMDEMGDMDHDEMESDTTDGMDGMETDTTAG